MRVARLFLLQMMIAFIAGTAIILIYSSLPESPLTGGLAFFAVGVLMGWLLRKSPVGIGVGVLVLLLVSIVLAAYGGWLYSQLIVSAEDTEVGFFGRNLPCVWAGLTFLGVLVLGLKRAGDRGKGTMEYKPTSQEVKAFIEENDLFVSAEELEEMAARPGGLVCAICREPYTGEEITSKQWKDRWVRCPRVAEHVYHAWDFERAEWRCPVDKSLLYRPKFG